MIFPRPPKAHSLINLSLSRSHKNTHQTEKVRPWEFWLALFPPSSVFCVTSPTFPAFKAPLICETPLLQILSFVVFGIKRQLVPNHKTFSTIKVNKKAIFDSTAGPVNRKLSLVDLFNQSPPNWVSLTTNTRAPIGLPAIFNFRKQLASIFARPFIGFCSLQSGSLLNYLSRRLRLSVNAALPAEQSDRKPKKKNIYYVLFVFLKLLAATATTSAKSGQTDVFLCAIYLRVTFLTFLPDVSATERSQC